MRQQAIKEISAKAASERISNGTEKEKEEKKEGEMETFGDWRSMLQRLNDQVKLVVKLPEVVTRYQNATSWDELISPRLRQLA